MFGKQGLVGGQNRNFSAASFENGNLPKTKTAAGQVQKNAPTITKTAMKFDFEYKDFWAVLAGALKKEKTKGNQKSTEEKSLDVWWSLVRYSRTTYQNFTK